MHIDHVAILVERIEEALETWHLPEAGDIADFPKEGTRELYCGDSRAAGRLLLMQATGPGPYRRALETRGPGLHHIALAVPDLGGYVDSLAGTGWLLHPISLQTFTASRQAWLCRPGFPCLVELTEESLNYTRSYVTQVALAAHSASDAATGPAIDQKLQGLIDALNCEDLSATSARAHQITLGESTIRIPVKDVSP